ncbi:MAG: deoxyribose-phosphate aldolase [Thermoguttaceae bacterium]
MFQSLPKISSLLDVSAVQATSCQRDVECVADVARRFGCVAAFALPSFTPLLIELLRGTSVRVGGAVGFPSGGETTEMKVAQARELCQLGCTEIDMVMNIGRMLSGDTDFVYNDIAAVRKTLGAVPLKVILECTHLSDDKIVRAAEIAADAGATWVKTGTGWTTSPTTRHQVELLQQAVGNRCQIKAAGGVRDLDTLLDLYNAGARRFGIGYKTAETILNDAKHRGGEQEHEA